MTQHRARTARAHARASGIAPLLNMSAAYRPLPPVGAATNAGAAAQAASRGPPAARWPGTCRCHPLLASGEQGSRKIP